MNAQGPDPRILHPMAGFPQICFIKNTVTNPNIIIGDYSYYDDPENSENFESNVLYHFPFIGDKLIIGKFCAIARGVKFIMNGANHSMAGFSTYPFFIFSNGWERVAAADEDAVIKEETITQLLEIAWWHWDIAKISRNLEAIVGADIAALQSCR